MAGLLDFISSPAGMGLLSAVAGGMAGTRRGQPINSMGRGLVTGLQGYQGAQETLLKNASLGIENKYKQLQTDTLSQAIAKANDEKAWSANLSDVLTPQAAKPAAFNVGGQSFGNAPDAITSAQNMYSLPTGAMPDSLANPYQQDTKPLAYKPQDPGLDMPTSPDLAYKPQDPGLDMPTSPQQTGIQDFSGGQAAPITQQAATPGGVDPQRLRQYFAKPGNPDQKEYLKSLMPKASEPYSLSPGQVRYGADNKIVASTPTENKDSPLARLLAERAALAPDDPNRAAYDNAIQKSSESTKIINNSPDPVTPITVQDPNDPYGTIVINGRNPEQVFGKGPKLTQVGAAEQKLSLGLPQAKLRVASMVQNLDRLNSAISGLYHDKGLSNITGTVFGRTPNVTDAANSAQNQLDSIKSQIFQSSLQSMREASKTGGAVGNVSDREGDKLEKTLAGLNQVQGTPDFKNELAKAYQQIKQSKSIIQAAFDEQYGGVQSVQRPGNSMQPASASQNGATGKNANTSGTRKVINGRIFEHDGKGWIEVK